MAEADTVGPLVVRHELAEAAALVPDLWQPDPLIETLVRTGQGFASR